MDLRQLNFDEVSKVPVKGDWEFYWNHLYDGDGDKLPRIDPDSIQNYIHLPGVWNGKNVDGVKISGVGYATMRIQVLLPSTEKDLALSFPSNFYAVHSVWINGVKREWNGIPGVTPDTTDFLEHDLIDYLILDSEVLDLVVVVSNFRGNTRWGGVRYPFYIGEVTSIRSGSVQSNFFSFFIFSSILIIGIYHLSFFWNYRKDKLPVFFAFFCFVVSSYSLITSSSWVVLFPKMSPNGIFRIEFLLELLLTPLCFLFLRYLFPKDFSNIVLYVLMAIVGIKSIIAIVLPIERTSLVYEYSLYIPLIFGSYILFVVIKAFFLRRKFSGIILFSVSILFVFMLNDVLNGLINVVFIFPYSFPLGLLIFISLHSHMISERQAEAFKNAESYLSLQKKYNQQAKSQAEERARIARDIHDSIGSEITALLTFFDSKGVDPMDSIAKMKKQLAGILINIRDIVYLLGQEKKEAEILEGEIEKYISRLILSNRFEIEYEIHPVSGFLGIEKSLNLQRIFLELMTNIIRHSKAKKISVRLYKKERKIRLVIVNDGDPFQWRPNDRIPGSFGLDGLHMRANKMQAKFRIFHSAGLNFFMLTKNL